MLHEIMLRMVPQLKTSLLEDVGKSGRTTPTKEGEEEEEAAAA